MRTAEQWLDEYGASHQNATNEALHWVCVPVILWCVLGLLWIAPFPIAIRTAVPFANWATLITLLAIVYYALLSVPLALGILPLLMLMLWSIDAVDHNTLGAAVADLRFAVRPGVDRTVHRPCDREEAPVLSQGSSISSDRTAVAAVECLPASRYPFLAFTLSLTGGLATQVGLADI